jgi:hypothetical protein
MIKNTTQKPRDVATRTPFTTQKPRDVATRTPFKPVVNSNMSDA